MKRKLLLALIACVVLSGCGSQAGNMGGGKPEQGSTVTITESGGTGEGRTQEAGENTQKSGNKSQEAGENTPKSGNKSQEAGESTQESGNKSSEVGEGQVKKLGDNGGREITPVTLKNAYQRAVFLADQVYEENGKNTLVSPLSLEMALGLAAEGASGETAKELYKYLGNEKYADWVEEYLQFAKSLESSSDKGKKMDRYSYLKYDFRYEMANSLWVRKGDKLSKEYQKLVERKFGAVAENVDFEGKPAEAEKKINSWCDEKTHGMIEKIVNQDMFSPDLAAVLINSVYFESPWVEKWGLVEHEFKNLNGESTKQEMLSSVVGQYYENSKCTAFAKNYYNGFQFIGILPKKQGEFQISDLDIESLLESATYDYDVDVIAPKLNYETTANNIVDILKAQGVQKAFDGENAEFDRLLEGRMLHIDDIIQKCKIEMDEEGTRAAAVTAILMEDNCASISERKVKKVYLDRPFAFLIYDSVNDQIVFVGKVTEL